MNRIFNKRKIGIAGNSCSAISFGCWGISNGWGRQESISSIRRTIEIAYSRGINIFDTATVYGNGLGEEIFKTLPWRKDVVISTKISSPKKPIEPIGSIYEFYPKKYCISQVEKSLKNLNVDIIDILHLHNWYPVWEKDLYYILDIFEELKRRNLIKNAGISIPKNNYSNKLVSGGVIDVVQLEYNLFQKAGVHSFINSAIKNNISVLLRSSLLQGVLTMGLSKFISLPYNDPRKKRYSLQKFISIKKRVADFCKIAGISENQFPYFAIAHSLSNEIASSTIIGMRTTEQVINNTNLENYKFSVNQLKAVKRF